MNLKGVEASDPWGGEVNPDKQNGVGARDRLRNLEAASQGGSGGCGGHREGCKSFDLTEVKSTFYTFKKSKSTYKQTKIKNTKKAWLKKP